MNAARSRWIYRSNSILTLLNANLFIINRIEHIESKESVDSIIYNQSRVFVVFVRVLRNENTTSHETHSEQWVRIDSALSKIKNICRNINKKACESIMNLTSIQSAQRACDKLVDRAIDHEHVIDLKNMQ